MTDLNPEERAALVKKATDVYIAREIARIPPAECMRAALDAIGALQHAGEGGMSAALVVARDALAPFANKADMLSEKVPDSARVNGHFKNILGWDWSLSDFRKARTTLTLIQSALGEGDRDAAGTASSSGETQADFAPDVSTVSTKDGPPTPASGLMGRATTETTAEQRERWLDLLTRDLDSINRMSQLPRKEAAALIRDIETLSRERDEALNWRKDAEGQLVEAGKALGFLKEQTDKTIADLQSQLAARGTRKATAEMVEAGYDALPVDCTLDRQHVRVALNAALALMPSEPEGWKLVPLEADDNMLDVGLEIVRPRTLRAALYRAMLAAAPPPPTTGDGNG